MILWIGLFLLIVAISFVLALLSMRDYSEIPEESKEEYGLFLIRQPQAFGINFIDYLGRSLLEAGLLVSVERLFKGNQAALTIFGPKRILEGFSANLNLLELEDYTRDLLSDHLSVWEMGLSNLPQTPLSGEDFFTSISKLGPEDQFFWQVVLEAKKEGENIAFKSQIRAVIYVKEPLRKQVLVPLFQNLKFGSLVKIPKPHSAAAMMEFYRLRTMDKLSSGPVLSSDGVVRLLRL